MRVSGIIPSILILLTGCLVTPIVPVQHKVGDKVFTETGGTVLGFIPWGREMTEDKTIEQKKEDLKFEGEKRKQENSLITEERQKKTAYWFGVIMFSVAAVLVFIGYFARGWKFFGGGAFIAASLGTAAWSAEHIVPYLKYPAYALAGGIVLWTMSKLKGFSLLQRLRDSDSGSLF